MGARNLYKYLGIMLVLIISSFFVAKVPLQIDTWPISVIAILGFSAPVAIGAVAWLGRKYGWLLVAGLGLYALIFETLAVKTGLPYGEFSYSALLGPQLFGSTPLTVLVAWTPLVLGVLYVTQAYKPLARIGIATALLVASDVVLDPAAVHVGFWQWLVPGPFYGVPFINFAGWILSGVIAIAAVVLVSQRLAAKPLPSILGLNYMAILLFWSSVNLFAGQFIPFGLGMVLLVWSYTSYRQHTAQTRLK